MSTIAARGISAKKSSSVAPCRKSRSGPTSLSSFAMTLVSIGLSAARYRQSHASSSGDRRRLAGRTLC